MIISSKSNNSSDNSIYWFKYIDSFYIRRTWSEFAILLCTVLQHNMGMLETQLMIVGFLAFLQV